MRHAEIRDFRCRHDVVGDQGPRVLLIMGFGMTGLAWQPVLRHMAHDHQLCWFDVRGLAGSTPGRLDRHTLPDLADDAAALLDHLGWDRAHVVGISMGGMIAQHVALRHRDRVRSLSLLATHPGGGLRTLPTLEAVRLFVAANVRRGDDRVAALRALLFPPDSEAARDGRLDAKAFAEVSSPSPVGVRVRHLRAILRHDTRARLGELAGLPTLVLRPDQDLLVPPRCNDDIARRVPGARLVGFPDGGHGLLAQHPERVADELRAHIAAAERA